MWSRACHWNDDGLGRRLDARYAAGTTLFFGGMQAAGQFVVEIHQCYLEAMLRLGDGKCALSTGAESGSEGGLEPTPMWLFSKIEVSQGR